MLAFFLFAMFVGLIGTHGVLLILIAVAWHEMGHLFVARYVGVYVQEISVGFGPKLVSLKLNLLRVYLRAIPLGGYVDPADWNDVKSLKTLDPAEAREVKKPAHWLANQPIHEQIAVAAAGPAFNFVMAAFCLFITGYQGSVWTVLTSGFDVAARREIFGFDLPGNTPPLAVLDGANTAFRLGAFYILRMFAVLNVQLGLLNLVPLPPFDGGHIVAAPFIRMATRGLKGKALEKQREEVQKVIGGISLVVLLLVVFGPILFR